MTRIVCVILLAGFLAAPLAACGKKGSLEPPPREDQSEEKKAEEG